MESQPEASASAALLLGIGVDNVFSGLACILQVRSPASKHARVAERSVVACTRESTRSIGASNSGGGGDGGGGGGSGSGRAVAAAAAGAPRAVAILAGKMGRITAPIPAALLPLPPRGAGPQRSSAPQRLRGAARRVTPAARRAPCPDPARAAGAWGGGCTRAGQEWRWR
eukprot:239441-Chlamydomonas_euryale.AAC.8